METVEDHPMITTIIPTYRRPLLLKRAIESVLCQTYHHYKICVYDNASGDETANIMKDLCNRDERINYHCHSENIGMMGNYEFALAKVNTPYFTILSDDDIILPEYFDTAMHALKQHPEAAFAACGTLAITGSGKIIADPLSHWDQQGYYCPVDGAMEMLKHKARFPIPTSILFQHRCVKEISPDFSQEMQLMWDPDYLLQIAARHPIVIVKDICSFFAVHENGFSSHFYKRIFDEPQSLTIYFRAINKMMDRIENNPTLFLEQKAKLNNALLEMVKNEMVFYIREFGRRKQNREAYVISKIFKHHFGHKTDHRLLLAYVGLNYMFRLLRPIKKAITTTALPLKNLLQKNTTFFEGQINKYDIYKEAIQEFISTTL